MYLENNEVKKYPFKIIAAWTLVVLWMAIIFMLSHQTSEASSSLSGQLTAALFRIISSDAGQQIISQTEAVIRALAHGFVFFILALLVSWAFETVRISEFKNAGLTFIVSILYAASDELHQVFVPGRAGQLQDFMVDLAGAAAAIIIYQLAKTIIDLKSELEVNRQEDLRL